MEPTDWRARVGDAIRQARTDAGLSIRAGARLAGIDEAVWRYSERGYRVLSGQEIEAQPSATTLIRIARVLRVDASSLLERAGMAVEEVVALDTLDARTDELFLRIDELVGSPDSPVLQVLDRGERLPPETRARLLASLDAASRNLTEAYDTLRILTPSATVTQADLDGRVEKFGQAVDRLGDIIDRVQQTLTDPDADPDPALPRP